MYFNEGGSFETSSASNGPVNWSLLGLSFSRNGKWESILRSIHYFCRSPQHRCNFHLRKISRIPPSFYQCKSGAKSAGKIAQRKKIHAFSSAKEPHSSHSLFTCVSPPISNTAGFPISSDDAGEAAVGEGSDEDAFDIMLIKR